MDNPPVTTRLTTGLGPYTLFVWLLSLGPSLMISMYSTRVLNSVVVICRYSNFVIALSLCAHVSF